MIVRSSAGTLSRSADRMCRIIARCIGPIVLLACHSSPSAERGRALLLATRDSLPRYVRSNLRCTSCHLDEGRRQYAAPLVDALVRYPQYRTRSARIETIEERVNGC